MGTEDFDQKEESSLEKEKYEFEVKVKPGGEGVVQKFLNGEVEPFVINLRISRVYFGANHGDLFAYASSNQEGLLGGSVQLFEGRIIKLIDTVYEWEWANLGR